MLEKTNSQVKRWWRNYRTPIILGLIIVLIMVVRMWNLAVPYFVQEDELVYTLNARFVWLTGRDSTGQWNPFGLTPIEPWFNELSATIWAMFMGLPFGNLINSRIGSGLIGLGLALSIGGIAEEVVKGSKKTTTDEERRKKATRVKWLVTFLALLNPWIWQASRANFDSLLSFFFYALGGWLFLKLKGWQKLWSIPIFFVGFYQYQGYKLLLLPWIAILVVWLNWSLGEEWLKKRRSFKEGRMKKKKDAGFSNKDGMIGAKKMVISLIMLVFGAGLTLYYAQWQLPNNSAMVRSGDILLPSSELVQDQTEKLQQETLKFRGQKKAINSWLTWLTMIADRYMSVYDTKLLFWETGEASINTYWMWYWGVFYLMDVILVGAGIWEVVKKKDWRVAFFLGLLLLAAPLPALINANGEGRWWLHRASFRILPLLVLAGLGADWLARKLNKIGKIIFLVFYGGGVILFVGLYFYRLPVTAALVNRYSPRVAADYLGRIPSEKKAEIYLTYGKKNYFDSWLFYNDLINKENAAEWQMKYQAEDYNGERILFWGDCLDIEKIALKEKGTALILQNGLRLCEDNNENDGELGSEKKEEKMTPLESNVSREWAQSLEDDEKMSIAIIKDVNGGDMFFVIDDQVCEKEELKAWTRFESPSNFKTKKMTNEEWCQQFMAKL